MYRQRVKRVRERGGKAWEGEEGRDWGGGGRGEFPGEDIISPMQIAFGLRPAEYTLALVARVRPCRIFRGPCYREKERRKKILSSERVSLSRCSTKSFLDPCRQVVSSESLLENGYSELSLLSLPLSVLLSSLEIVESNLLYKYYFFNPFFNFTLFFF